MLRTSLDQAYIKRTIRPLYGWSQTTPTHTYLDPDWDRSVDIYPGMVMMKGEGDTVTLIDDTGHPYGLAGLFVGGYDIDEVKDQGVNAFATWVLAPDAQFEILAPAFDTDETWEEPSDGTITLVHAQTVGDAQGKLVPAGVDNASDRPVARLISVVSDSKIVVGGLVGTQ